MVALNELLHQRSSTTFRPQEPVPLAPNTEVDEQGLGTAVIRLDRSSKAAWKEKDAYYEVRFLYPDEQNTWHTGTMVTKKDGTFLAYKTGSDEYHGKPCALHERFLDVLFQKAIVATATGDIYQIQKDGSITSPDSTLTEKRTITDILSGIVDRHEHTFVGRTGKELALPFQDHKRLWNTIECGLNKREAQERKKIADAIVHDPRAEALGIKGEQILHAFQCSTEDFKALPEQTHNLCSVNTAWPTGYECKPTLYFVHHSDPVYRRMYLRDDQLHVEQFFGNDRKHQEVWVEDQNPLTFINLAACFQDDTYGHADDILAAAYEQPIAPFLSRPVIVAHIEHPEAGIETLFQVPPSPAEVKQIEGINADQMTTIYKEDHQLSSRSTDYYESLFRTALAQTPDIIHTDRDTLERIYREARLKAETDYRKVALFSTIRTLAGMTVVPSNENDIAQTATVINDLYDKTQGHLAIQEGTGLTDFEQTRVPEQFAKPKDGYLGFQISHDLWKLLGIRGTKPSLVEYKTWNTKVGPKRFVGYEQRGNVYTIAPTTLEGTLFITNLVNAVKDPLHPSTETIVSVETIFSRNTIPRRILTVPNQQSFSMYAIQQEDDGTHTISQDGHIFRQPTQTVQEQSALVLFQYLQGELTYNQHTKRFEKTPATAPKPVTLSELPELYHAAVEYWHEARFEQFSEALYGWMNEQRTDTTLLTLPEFRIRLQKKMTETTTTEIYDPFLSRITHVSQDTETGNLSVTVDVRNPFNQKRLPLMVDVTDGEPDATTGHIQPVVSLWKNQPTGLVTSEWRHLGDTDLEAVYAASILSSSTQLSQEALLTIREQWIKTEPSGVYLTEIIDVEGRKKPTSAVLMKEEFQTKEHYVLHPTTPVNAPANQTQDTWFMSVDHANHITEELASPVTTYLLEKYLPKTEHGYIRQETFEAFLSDLEHEEEWQDHIEEAVRTNSFIFQAEQEPGWMTTIMLMMAIDERWDVERALKNGTYWEQIKNYVASGNGLVQTTFADIDRRSATAENWVVIKRTPQTDDGFIFFAGHHDDNTKTHLSIIQSNKPSAHAVELCETHDANGKITLCFHGDVYRVIHPLEKDTFVYVKAPLRFPLHLLNPVEANPFIASGGQLRSERFHPRTLDHINGPFTYVQGFIELMDREIGKDIQKVLHTPLDEHLSLVPKSEYHRIAVDLLARSLKLTPLPDYSPATLQKAWSDRILTPYQEFVATKNRDLRPGFTQWD